MTTSNLPVQLRKQVEDAKALIKPVAPSEGNTEGNTDDSAPVADNGTQPAELDQVSEPVVSPDPIPIQPAVENVEVTPVPEADQTPTLDTPQPDHRYEVLLGKYNAEVPRMAKQIRELQAENERLKQLPAPVADVPAPEPAAEKTVEVTDEMVRQVYSQDEIDEFGMEYWRMHMKGSLFMQAQQQSTPAQQVSPDVQPTPQIDNEPFYDHLAALVPDAADINVDPGFMTFLQGYDPVSRQQYIALLRGAESRGDSIAAAAIFDLHKSGCELTPEAPTIETPDPAPAVPSVSSQVAPSGKPTAVTPAGPTMTMSEYTKQSSAIARSSSSNPVRAGELRKVLRAAMKEGRVVDDNTGEPVVKVAT